MLAVMEDAGLILGGYAVTFGAIGLYALSVLRRARRTAARVPDEAKPWT